MVALRRASSPRRPHDATAALFARLRAANEHEARHIRDRIVAANLGLVVMVARRHENRRLDLDDLIQVGSIGLLTAIAKFDPARGVRFSTCAGHWIRHELVRALENTGRTIRMPSYFMKLSARVETARARWQNEHGRSPTPLELATAAGVSLRKLTDLAENYVHVSESLDAPLHGDPDQREGVATLLDFIASPEPDDSDDATFDERR